MLRKCINSMSKKELGQLPFYSWNCITFQMANRDIDLVIKNEEEMFLLIQYLSYKMKTIDGIKNSASIAIKEIMKNNKDTNQTKAKQHQLLQYKLWKKTCQRYRILIIRNKISFSALQQCLSVHELFLKTILKSYQSFVKHGHYVIPRAVTCKHEKLLYGLFNNIPGSMKDIIYSEACAMDKLEYKMQEKMSKTMNYGETFDKKNLDGKKSKKK